jgi:Fur family peroxide stress response transcriptional regulator
MEKETSKILRENRLKLTNARKEIYTFLKNTYSHPSAFDVFENVKQKLPGISYATVYNVLNKFVEKGIIQELSLHEDKKRFDGNTEPHIHLICLKCGKIDDSPFEKGKELVEAVSKKSGWQIKKFVLNIYGICKDCKRIKG